MLAAAAGSLPPPDPVPAITGAWGLNYGARDLCLPDFSTSADNSSIYTLKQRWLDCKSLSYHSILSQAEENAVAGAP